MKIQKGQKLTEEQKAEGRRFVIEVTEEERQALFEISRRKFVKQHPCIDGASLWAIKFALCHSEQYLNWLSGILSYERAEGLNQFDQVKGKIEMAAKQLARERI